MAVNENRFILAQLNFGENRVHFGGYDDQLGLEGALPHLLVDTLFSAICHGWLMTYGQDGLDTLLEEFKSALPPWRMSDGFPYFLEKNRATVYLPKPAGPLSYPNPEKAEWDSNSKNKKRLKKARFLQAEDMTAFLQGNFDTELLDVYPDLWVEATAPHVAINHGVGDSEPYSVNYLRFVSGAGLWVLFDLGAANSPWLPKLKEVLKMLGETMGLGGRKSTGAGRFTLTWSDESADARSLLEDIEKSGLSLSPLIDEFQLLMSIANPQPSEALKLKQPKTAKYQLINRGGFHYSLDPDWPGLIKKKPVAMLLAGSVIKGGLQGRLVDVTPDLETGKEAPHPLYRYGLGLTLGVPQ